MDELISLAKKNSFVVIGLLMLALFLQDRIHRESSTIRQEMNMEFATTRQAIAANSERLARLESLIEQSLLGKPAQ